MKKIFYLFLILGILGSCKAQITNNLKNKTRIAMIPTVDKNFETFDNVTYEKLYKINPHYQSEFLIDGSYIEMDKSKNGFSYSIINSNSYFSISKAYYINNNIKLKGLMFNNGYIQKGIWYEFDESGKLIKEIDYDTPYHFTFDNILEFCESEKIPLQKGPILQSTGYHTIIRRDFNGNSSWWKIEWLKKTDLIEVITLDGNTGKILKRENRNYINN